MNAKEIKTKRRNAGIAGLLLSRKSGISRTRISDIERGYVRPSEEELVRLTNALEELILVRAKLVELANECGWPESAI